MIRWGLKRLKTVYEEMMMLASRVDRIDKQVTCLEKSQGKMNQKVECIMKFADGADITAKDIRELKGRVWRIEHPNPQTIALKVKLLSDDAKLPTRGTLGSGGLDLYSVTETEVKPGTVETIHTGIAMEVPEGYCGLTLTRSGMGRNMVRLSAGANCAPDSDYRGELLVSLTNDGIYPWKIHKGDRVAQVVIVPFLRCVPVGVEELSETERGAGGFGSTGK